MSKRISVYQADDDYVSPQKKITAKNQANIKQNNGTTNSSFH
jgi:hypothetical protein